MDIMWRGQKELWDSEAGETWAFSRRISSHHKSGPRTGSFDGSGSQALASACMTIACLGTSHPGGMCACIISRDLHGMQPHQKTDPCASRALFPGISTKARQQLKLQIPSPTSEQPHPPHHVQGFDCTGKN